MRPLYLRCAEPASVICVFLRRMLEDQLMHVATAEIKSANRSRYDVSRTVGVPASYFGILWVRWSWGGLRGHIWASPR